MRLPNGFGSVYKLQGNRRRPFVVKKTIAGKPTGAYQRPTREPTSNSLTIFDFPTCLAIYTTYL